MGRIKARRPRRTRSATAPATVSVPAARAPEGRPVVVEGRPVVVEGFHLVHPLNRGWDLESWILPPGHGNPDDGQHAAQELQELLDLAPQVTLEQAEVLRGGPVTLHYYVETGYDGDEDLYYFQGVVHSAAAGWFAVERPWNDTAGSDDHELALAWSAPSAKQLLDGLEGGLPDLRADLDVDRWETAFLSHELRAALAAQGTRS